MKRPLAITITAWFFILAGIVGFVYHFYEYLSTSFDGEAILILFVRMLAIIGGILLLKAHNLGRWLLIAWMVYHVALSFCHNPMQVVMHTIFLLVLLIVFFHARVRRFFKDKTL